MHDILLSVIKEGAISATALLTPILITWAFTLLRSNQKAAQVLKALQIDDQKQKMMSDYAVQVVTSIEEKYYDDLVNKKIKTPTDVKENTAIESVKAKFPDAGMDDISHIVKAAVASIRPSDPSLRLDVKMKALLDKDIIQSTIAPDMEKAVIAESMKGVSTSQ